MLNVYPAIFYEENAGGYSVVFPDLNHLATCGDTLEEAFAMAIDCLAGYLYEEQLSGHTLPQPTPLTEVDIHCEDDPDDDYKAVFVNMVSVDVSEYAKIHFNKSVKKTLTIPKWLNDVAVANNINFSKTLQNALLDELGIEPAGNAAN